MKKFVSILRGVNVSGKNLIKMTELADLYRDLGFSSVSTYIQSGNVLFRSENQDDPGNLAAQISNSIKVKFGYGVPVLLRSVEEMAEIIALNPFSESEGYDSTRLHVTFLSGLPDKEFLNSIQTFQYPTDRFFIRGVNVYVYCPDGYGKTKYSNTFFESKLKVSATTRNWNTVEKLYELLGNVN